MGPIGITGVGLVSGAGMSLKAHMERVLNDSFPAPTNITQEIYGFDPNDSPKSFKTTGETCPQVFGVPYANEVLGEPFPKRKRYDRYQLFALIAALEALEHRTLNGEDEALGCFIGTGGAGTAEASEAFLRIARNERISPFALMRFLPGMTVGLLAECLHFQGFGSIFSRGCVASADAIAHALDQLRLGRISQALAGGAEAPITPISIAAFCGAHVLGNNHVPYSKDRNGLIPGEGAAMLMLERHDRIQAHKKRVLAEIIGYSSGNQWLEKGVSFTDISSKGVTQAITSALACAKITSREVGHVFTHATGTVKGDPMELRGIYDAWKGKHLPSISSVKSFTGHTFGASGAVSLALAVGSLVSGITPHTHGLTHDTIDPECVELGFSFPIQAQRLRTKVVMVLSHGFGGAYSCFILRQS